MKIFIFIFLDLSKEYFLNSYFRIKCWILEWKCIFLIHTRNSKARNISYCGVFITTNILYVSSLLVYQTKKMEISCMCCISNPRTETLFQKFSLGADGWVSFFDFCERHDIFILCSKHMDWLEWREPLIVAFTSVLRILTPPPSTFLVYWPRLILSQVRLDFLVLLE